MAAKITRDLILESARNLFNEHGYFHVTFRDLAKECSISTGNITYYFPAKKDILLELFDLMIKEGTVLIPEGHMESPGPEHLVRFMQIQHRNALKYRFFFTDIVRILDEYPDIRKMYDRVIELRQKEFNIMAGSLIKSKYLSFPSDGPDPDTIAILYSMWNHFWISHSQVKKEELNEDLANRYMFGLLHIVRPLFSVKGKKLLDEMEKKLRT